MPDPTLVAFDDDPTEEAPRRADRIRAPWLWTEKLAVLLMGLYAPLAVAWLWRL